MTQLTFRANGDANSYALLDDEGHWFMSLLVNGRQMEAKQIENMRRLAACWNACQGIDNQDLEAGSVSIMHKLHDAAAKRVLDQRDELLTTINRLLDITQVTNIDSATVEKVCRAAIAKAECGADATQHQASPKQEAQELPEIGSRWTHRNGAPYTVLMIANADTQCEVRYPVTVVYRGDNGKVWSRAASDWHRSMTASPQPDPFAAQPAPQPTNSIGADGMAPDPLQGAANWLNDALMNCDVQDIQQRLLVGYNRAKRLHDAAMAQKGGAA